MASKNYIPGQWPKEEEEMVEIPFKSTDNTPTNWKAFLLWLAFFISLLAVVVILGGCSTAKRTQFKNHCNVQMVG
jgi:hypothetical protein